MPLNRNQNQSTLSILSVYLSPIFEGNKRKILPSPKKFYHSTSFLAVEYTDCISEEE